jgi:hypothetical protein
MTKRTIKRILDIKEQLRNVRRTELAEAAKQVETAELRANHASSERARAISAVTEIGEISGRDLEGRSAIVAIANREERGARADLFARVEERTRRSAILQEVDREVRLFDALQQRILQFDKRCEKAQEQKESDEAALRIRSGR